ncbi:MAG: hypothetical protein R8J84_03100, partial [Mariprofundales bacterium]
EALKDLPHQKVGLYLWENQGWESAFIHAWRQHGHGRLVGVPHATIAFWHLNNMDDPRTVEARQGCAKPLPDLLAVNGSMAWNAFIAAGYPAQRLAEVEAARFQYLLDSRARQSKDTMLRKEGKRLLILGDFAATQTMQMLHCVQHALSLLEGMQVSVTIKFHPVCSITEEEVPLLSFETTDAALGGIMQEFDLAFVSNTTSAGLDVLLSNLAVAVFLDGETFNHSPLRGVDGVCFVRTSNDLAGFLQSSDRNRVPPQVEDFFWLDAGFCRWRRLVAACLDGEVSSCTK